MWLFVGHLTKGQTSLMRMTALQRNGLTVEGFDVRKIWNRQSWLSRQLTTRFESGAVVREINDGIVKAVREHKPTHVWFDKPELIRPDVLQELKRLGAFTIYYTPDPYFTLDWKRTRLMDACLPEFNLLVTSKTYEVEKFRSIGPDVLYLPLGYCPEVHRRVAVSDSDRISVGFVGGWEPRREELLEKIAETGVSVKIWGYAWDHLIDGKWTLRRHYRLRRLALCDKFRIHKSRSLSQSIVGGEALGDDYARALSASDMGVGFLRTICPDQHTTRTFEIPACGSVLVADRTDEHRELFEEDLEAIYFQSADELLDKVKFLATHRSERERMAEAGFERCRKSGYSYDERMRTVLKHLETHH